MVDIVALSLTIVCAFAIVGVLIYIYKQIQDTKAFVKNELKKFVKAINNAQLNEFNHDKLTEQNILAIDAKVEKIKETLSKLEKKYSQK